MPKVKFIATRERPTWEHKKGGKKEVPYGRSSTLRIVPPEILRDGSIVEMDDFEAQWVTKAYPANFEVIPVRSPPRPKYKPEADN